MALIVMGSSRPASDIPRLFTLIPHLDKIAHTVEYTILGLLLARVAMRLRPLRLAQLTAVCGAFALAFGITDELHQSFVPGRSVSLVDLAADTAGGALGALAWVLGHRSGHAPAAW
ncbi:MAG: VanZ family protein [Candidatus Sumerlaeia bacterium]|nr:VanZ family protein [Candidatus Sumerlaeia bacterium]